MRTIVIVLATTVVLLGCARYTLVKPERQMVGDLYTVEPQVEWSRTTGDRLEMWTIDGPALEAVYFVNGIEEGASLVKSADSKKTLPVFRKHMTPTEVLERVVDTVKAADDSASLEAVNMGLAAVRADRMGARLVEASNLRPTKFGHLPGFRFDLSFIYPEGLDGSGIVVGAIHENKLYLILYVGARLHYYPRYRDVVERLIGSIQISS